MIKYNKNKKGFTLLEITISLLLFIVIFIILFQVTVKLLNAMREAKIIKSIYTEGRHVVEGIKYDIKTMHFDFECMRGDDGEAIELKDPLCVRYKANNKGYSKIIALKDDSGLKRKLYYYDDEEEKLVLVLQERDSSDKLFETEINHPNGHLLLEKDILEKADFHIYPLYNPYIQANAGYNSLQFQPKVTLLLDFAKAFKVNKHFNFKYQTTVLNKIYK